MFLSRPARILLRVVHLPRARRPLLPAPLRGAAQRGHVAGVRLAAERLHARALVGRRARRGAPRRAHELADDRRSGRRSSRWCSGRWPPSPCPAYEFFGRNVAEPHHRAARSPCPASSPASPSTPASPASASSSRAATLVVRPRHVLHRHRLQQRGRPDAPAGAEPRRGVGGPRRRPAPDLLARAPAAARHARCSPAGCSRSPSASTRSSSRPSPRRAGSRRCRCGSSRTCSGTRASRS